MFLIIKCLKLGIVDDEDDEDDEDTLVFNEKHNVWVDTDNNLCYTNKDTTPGPIGQVQRGMFLKFPDPKMVKPKRTPEQERRLVSLQNHLAKMNQARSMGIFLDEDQRDMIEDEIKKLNAMS